MDAVLMRRLPKIVRFSQLIITAVMLMLPAIAVADPAKEANAVIDRWSAAYSANNPEAVVKNYRPDAVLLGTVSPIMSAGTEAIRTYFSPLKGSGNKNAIGERRTLVLSDNCTRNGLLRVYSDERGQTCTGTVSLHYASH
jgi:hypothetical protein